MIDFFPYISLAMMPVNLWFADAKPSFDLNFTSLNYSDISWKNNVTVKTSTSSTKQ